MGIADHRLHGTIMMRDEMPLETVQFEELMKELLPAVAGKLRDIAGKRSDYKKRKQPDK